MKLIGLKPFPPALYFLCQKALNFFKKTKTKLLSLNSKFSARQKPIF